MDLEAQLTAALNDPETMNKVMALAQSLGLDHSASPSQPQDPPPAAPSGEVEEPLRAVLSALRESGGDDRTADLLRAIKPMLRQERQPKIDRAIRAARMAKLAAVAARQLDLGDL
jgi:transcriptional regulator GlxA family with amidase domain